MNADQELRIIIKSIYEGGNTRAALGDLRLLVEAHKAENVEASKALDYYRQMRSIGAGSGGNTGAGLATSPSLSTGGTGGTGGTPGGGGATGTGGMGYGMRRHFGAMAGQLLGMPGLGMMAAVGGMAAGIGVVTLALEKLVRVFTDFNAKVDEGVASVRRFELAGLSIDSTALRTQKLTQSNKDFALSYAQIDRQVRTVATEVKNLLEIETNQISMEQRRDDAATQRALSEAALRNRFNPVAMLKDREAIEEAAFARRTQRERDEEAAILRSIKLHETLSAARKVVYETEKTKLQGALGPMQGAAEMAGFNAETAESDAKLRIAAVEKLRAIAIKNQGVPHPFAMASAISDVKALGIDLPIGLDAFGRPDYSRLLPAIGTADKSGAFPQGSILGRLQDQIMSARAGKSATSFEVDQQAKKISATNEEIHKAGVEAEQLEIQRKVLEEKLKSTQPARNAAEQDIKGAMQNDLNRALQGIESTDTTGGVGSLQGVESRLDRMISIWEATV